MSKMSMKCPGCRKPQPLDRDGRFAPHTAGEVPREWCPWAGRQALDMQQGRPTEAVRAANAAPKTAATPPEAGKAPKASRYAAQKKDRP